MVVVGSTSARSVPVHTYAPPPSTNSMRATALTSGQAAAEHVASLLHAAAALGIAKSLAIEVTRWEMRGTAMRRSLVRSPAGSSSSITAVAPSIAGAHQV